MQHLNYRCDERRKRRSPLLGGLQPPPSGEPRGSTLMPSRSSGWRTRRGRPETDIGSGSGCGFEMGGEGLKTCGMIVFPQENLTLFAGPNRAPMGSKAGPLCMAAARGDP
jgi:hypothetical protein